MKKLFVSSTFKDMQLERDSLKKHIIPELNTRLRDWGIKIAQTDLRWGISTSNMSAADGEQKVLNVCLDEINRARPYMLVILGDRYGWIPSPAIIDMNAKGRGITLKSNDISVTQLEIEYIAFTEKWDESRIFFYFRDLDYGNMPREERAVYDSESTEAREKLNALKRRIEDKFPEQIRHYSLKYEDGKLCGIEEFEKAVLNDLYLLFERDTLEDEKRNVNERVAAKLHLEALESLQVYSPHYDLQNDSNSSTVNSNQRNEQIHTYIGGAPGCGKTTSVMAHYAALYAYLNQSEPCWERAKPLYARTDHPMAADTKFTSLVKSINAQSCFPLYLQLGNSKDIKDERDLLRTLNYFLAGMLLLPAPETVSIEEGARALGGLLKKLTQTDMSFYLFLDDATSETMKMLFTLEHSLTESEIAEIMEHFYFYISLSNDYEKAPVYYPFYEYSGTASDSSSSMYAVSNYIFNYAKKLGKELSPEVVRHLRGYYGGYGETFEDARLYSISKPQANLMANYFMNLTSEDFRIIRETGNDMNAIESRQLALLGEIKDSFNATNDKESFRNIALLNIKKFEKNHSDKLQKAISMIYLLTGAPFSMEEAEELFGRLGFAWSDLDFVSYFDDFKEFYSYDRSEDSYRLLPQFGAMIRPYFIDKYFPTEDKLTEAITAILSAIEGSSFYDAKKPLLFPAVLLMPSGEGAICELKKRAKDFPDLYLFGEALGKSIARHIKALTDGEITEAGRTVGALIDSRESDALLNGFYDGIGGGFQDHEYERRILTLSDAIEETSRSTDALAAVRLALMRAHCYMWWKNDEALNILYEAEPMLYALNARGRVRFLAILAQLIDLFKRDTPAYDRLRDTVIRHLPIKERVDLGGEHPEDIRLRSDLYALSFVVSYHALTEDFFSPSELIAPFMNTERFAALGLNSIAVAIFSEDGKGEGGMAGLVARTRMMMESLAADFPSSHYASRLISKCMVARFLAAMKLTDEERLCAELERYYYPYQKAIIAARDGSSYQFIGYVQFLQIARYFHLKTGVSRSYDELFWEATQMGRWTGVLFWQKDLSIDVTLAVCWAYVTFLQDPDFHDMISDDAATYNSHYAEQDSENPSRTALNFRLTLYLAAVLHNPSSRIMKPRLKKLFKSLTEYYGDYMTSLSSARYTKVRDYIEGL